MSEIDPNTSTQETPAAPPKPKAKPKLKGDVKEPATLPLEQIKDVTFVKDGMRFRLDDFRQNGVYILKPYYGK